MANDIRDDASPAAVPTDTALAEVVDLLGRLVDGDLRARAWEARYDGTVLALARGVNTWADHVETERREFEEQARARTSELEQLNDDVMRLSEFGNLLQACENTAEAFEVIEHEVGLLFPGLAGALYLFNSSRNMLELKASWGDLETEPAVPREHCWAVRRGQQHLVLAASPRLSCEHVLERWGDSICYPMSAQGETLGMLHLMGRSLQRPGTVLLTPGKQRLGITMAEQTALSLANLRMRDTLAQQALRDPLTGLYNRRFVDECLPREVSRADRNGASFGVLMADIDNFKSYNDLHGHDAGDAILGAVASTVRNLVRSEDIACRYGGEELLVVLGDVDESTLIARAEELRAGVAATTVVHEGSKLPAVTISIGAALYPQHGLRPGDVVRTADSALFTAKAQGRNRAVAAPWPESVLDAN